MQTFNIGDDAYNVTLNRMGMVMGVDGGRIVVRTSKGLETWECVDCENRTESDEF